MGFSDIELRHIVDVDGKLLGIDAEVIDTASLLARAGCPSDSLLWMIDAGERFAVHPRQFIRLSEQNVVFFETSAGSIPWNVVALLAA
ncbi:MAG: hypothetical protein CNE89_08615 [Sphingomonadaceae bacterium MED-G03]|jgi:hypothetical protein|nr:MAG: hypothetical protein CNE89_08615 [Sphingomonadaceae bacterium MED-G03]